MLQIKSPPMPRPFFAPDILARKPNPHAPYYLDNYYWWAYVDPWAVRFFERDWLINLILLGNYKKLGNAALEEFGDRVSGRSLQITCCYGDLTPRLAGRVAAGGGALDVLDVMPVQLENLKRKLKPDAPVNLMQMDSTALAMPDAHYDQVLLFFLLHEQPQLFRERTLGEALRVLKPGGKLVIVDYGKPNRNNPLRWLLLPVLGKLEPFAVDLWRREMDEVIPELARHDFRRAKYFGGLYQKIVVRK